MPCYRFDLESKRISTDTTAATPSALYADMRSDTLYGVIGVTVVPMHGGATETATWRSKVFKIPSGAYSGFAWCRINGQLANGVTLRFYANGVLVHTKTGVTTIEPIRMPAIEARAWEVEISSRDRITSLVLADSLEGLL